MVDFTPVDHDPFADSGPKLTPVDHDPFADQPQSGINKDGTYDLSQWGEFPRAIADIPSEIGQQYSNAWQGLKEGLTDQPGETRETASAKALPTAMNAAYLGSVVGPAVVGAVRSLIGHPMADLEHKVGEWIAPQTAATDNPEEMFETAAGNVETALSAGRPGVGAAPSVVPNTLRHAGARVANPIPTTPERAAAVETLRQADPQLADSLTAGMVSGNTAIQRAESTLGNAPFAGQRWRQTIDRLNGRFTNYVARQFGEDVDRITPEVLQRARDRLGDQFEHAAENMSIIHDQRLGNDLTGISRELMAEGLSDPEVNRIMAQLNNVQNGFVTQTTRSGATRGVMEGNVYQTLTRKNTPLARAIDDQNPNISYYATRIRSALDDAMERSANRPGTRPGVGMRQAMEDLREARRQWFNMLAAQGATTAAGGAAAEGVVTPQRLRQMLTNSGDKKTAYALGRSDLGRVARAGNILTEGLPNSNTAERSLLTAIPSALIGGATLGEPMTGLLAGAAAPGMTGRFLLSRPVQNWLINRALGPYRNVPTAPNAAATVPFGWANQGPVSVHHPARYVPPVGTPPRFPWLGTTAIPHAGEDQQRARGGRALNVAYKTRRQRANAALKPFGVTI